MRDCRRYGSYALLFPVSRCHVIHPRINPREGIPIIGSADRHKIEARRNQLCDSGGRQHEYYAERNHSIFEDSTRDYPGGPESNPCGTSSDYVVTVPGGQERLTVVEASVFQKSVLVVSQGTAETLPFSVTVE